MHSAAPEPIVPFLANADAARSARCEELLDPDEEFPEEEALSDEPAERLRQLGRLRSGYAWEHIRQSLHPLLLARAPMIEIAGRFDVSVHTIYRWRDRLHEEMRREAVTMQPRDFIMESLTSFREVRAEAWQGYHAAETPKQRQRFLDLIIKVESSLVKLGHAIGLYGGRGDRPLHPGTYNDPTGEESGAEALKRMLHTFLACRPANTQDGSRIPEAEVEPAPAPAAPPPPPGFVARSRQRRPEADRNRPPAAPGSP